MKQYETSGSTIERNIQLSVIGQNQTNHNGESERWLYIRRSQWELRVQLRDRPLAWENAKDQVTPGFSFISDWLKGGDRFLDQSKSVIEKT